MDFERHQNDLRVQRKANRTLGAVLALLGVCQLISLVVIASIVGSERTVIVPPNIDKSFWVSKDKASREYLEQMGYFLMQLTLNVTPQSVDHQAKLLLQYAAPASFGELRTALLAAAERLKRDGASTVGPSDGFRSNVGHPSRFEQKPHIFRLTVTLATYNSDFERKRTFLATSPIIAHRQTSI